MAPKLKVACAIIINSERKILLAQRSPTMKHPLQWEFPGGKIKKEEDCFEAIRREILEELNVEVVPRLFLKVINWDYSDVTIELQAVICELESENFILLEHSQIEWFSLDDMQKKSDLLPADQEFLMDLALYLNS